MCAYFAGYMLIDSGPDAWRLMLVLGAAPALLVLPMRLTMPESPPWLIDRGSSARAARIISRHCGAASRSAGKKRCVRSGVAVASAARAGLAPAHADRLRLLHGTGDPVLSPSVPSCRTF